MIRIGKLTDYGVVIMNHLAQGGVLSLSAGELATQVNMPLPTVSKILKALTQAGLLCSQRGTKGGYHLSRPAERISLIEIIDALEEPLALTQCSSQEGLCAMESECCVREGWIDINGIIRDTLGQIDLRQLAQKAARKHPSTLKRAGR
ncbi:MAG: SUF system Fe-S cluster assembly regulator [Gammaproteobacteria bacterium RBG_16_57_12]|nr:MAG: SUF system Fe-S cluster assembly regulator [Gammaproteobacteria bacterium RBG_16_57_12]